MIKGIIFDFSGTLAYSTKHRDPIKTCELLRKNGYDVWHQEWEAAYKFVFFVEYPKGGINSYEQFTKRVLEMLGLRPTKLIVKKVSDYWKRNEKSRLYPDVRFVRRLKVKKAILTTIPYFRFKHLDLAGFNPIMTGQKIGRAKPHPNGFLKILRSWKLRPEEVLMVGDDMEIDIKPAKRLGLKTAFIDREAKGGGKADHVIKLLKELPKIIES